MSSDIFRFKRFSVFQPLGEGLKVGTDGVLVGAWCDLGGEQGLLLDAGTGTGVIALMLAQRAPGAEIHAVDIDPACCALAAASVAASPWPERVKVVESPVQRLAGSGARYDHVVSNPPYFAESLLPPSSERALARHTVELSHGELLESAAALLVDGGRLSMILPSAAASGLETLGASFGLHPRRVTQVHTRRGAPPKRTLMELVKTAAPPPPIRDALSIHEERGGEFTPEYRAMTAEFYLKF